MASPPAYAVLPQQVLGGLLTISLAAPTTALTTTGFDLVGPAVTSDPVTHIPAAAASVRVTATTGGTASTTAAATLPASPLFRLSYPSAVLSLDLTSTYTLSLTVTIPAQAASGRYSGTVTQTLV